MCSAETVPAKSAWLFEIATSSSYPKRIHPAGSPLLASLIACGSRLAHHLPFGREGFPLCTISKKKNKGKANVPRLALSSRMVTQEPPRVCYFFLLQLGSSVGAGEIEFTLNR